MAVAEKQVAAQQQTSTSQPNRVSMSFTGAVVVLLCLAVVFSIVPVVWGEVTTALELENPFLSSALLLIIEAVLIVGLILLLRKIEPSNVPRGYRAGIFFWILIVFIVAWLTKTTGAFLRGRDVGSSTGMVLTLMVFAGLSYLAFAIVRKKGFGNWMVALDDSGWFQAVGYKPNQGVRVRRGTIVGVLVVGAAGIITLINTRTFGTDRVAPNNWEWILPFVGGEDATYYIPLMFKVHYTLPVVMFLLLGWFAWRVVNYPGFADFLIATEAEMNKVSWASRKRLVQDTIVVLTTMFMMAIFLFFVDYFWIKLLSWIDVLQVDLEGARMQQQTKTPW